jgi:carboxymethylenebutenolidase
MTTMLHPDVRNVLPPATLSRRELVVTALASGFALAVRPVAAQTVIVTDTVGLEAGETRIPSGDVQLPAYYAMPATGRGHPVVLVVQEIFGVHEHIKDLCRRLAKLGYVAVAPELYARQGDVHGIADFRAIMPIVQKVPDAQVLADLDAAVAWAQATGRANARKLAITGFCWGGRIVWLYAAHNPRLKAGAAWYGRLTGEPTELQPENPVDVAASLKAPVLGLYGGRDRGIPPESIEAMRAALKHSKVESRIEVFPDAEHGFNADYRASYDAAAAKAAWADMLAWFRRHGAA